MRNAKVNGLAVLLTATMMIGCGNDNNETNNITPNNTTANNTTANNTTANNTTANNTTANNTTANNTTNTNTGPTAFEFGCADVVTPAGAVADTYGTYDITDHCIGADPFGAFDALCPTAVKSDFRQSNPGGKLIIMATDSAVGVQTVDFELDVWVPEPCTTTLAGGDCDGLATFVDAATGTTVTTCAPAAAGVAGDCSCTISGIAGGRIAASIVDNAGGTMTMTGLSQQADVSYISESTDFEFQTDGTELIMQQTDTTSTTATKIADANGCEIYCFGFMAQCNDNEGVTPYADDVDCQTQCGTVLALNPGTAGDTTGDTLACRTYHLFAAMDASDVGNPDTHCPHAQATSTAPCAN